ncbi:MAG: manganese efflux pump [Candidatus Brocadiia bacterium]|nr:manganese efflux pump [Candidatus Brocadiia bacterium]
MAGAVKMVLITFGLAADAFAVSIAEGVVVEEATHRHALRVSAMFGLFQGVMPILGWLAGEAIRSRLSGVDHWVAFGLLGFVGGKMLVDAALGIESSGKGKEHETGRSLCPGGRGIRRPSSEGLKRCKYNQEITNEFATLLHHAGCKPDMAH